MDGIPAVTAAQMAAVDRVMIDELGVDVLQLMEIAGRAVAVDARDRMLGGDAAGKRVLVLCGTGGNGGDGLVAARFLHAWGAAVAVWLSGRPDPARGIAVHQLAIVERLGLPVAVAEGAPSLPHADLVIDALLGFGTDGPPAGATAELIRAANAHPAPTLAVDLPSGLHPDDGTPFEPCVRAVATVTLALPKTGLLGPVARPFTGSIVVADIGVPAAVYRRLELEVGPIFARRDRISLG